MKEVVLGLFRIVLLLHVDTSIISQGTQASCSRFIFRHEMPFENRNMTQTGEKHLVFPLVLRIGKTLKNSGKSCLAHGLFWRPTVHGTQDLSRMHLVEHWEVREGRALSPPAYRAAWSAVSHRMGRVLRKIISGKGSASMTGEVGPKVACEHSRVCVLWPQLASWWPREAGLSTRRFQEEPQHCETCRSHSGLLSSRRSLGKNTPNTKSRHRSRVANPLIRVGELLFGNLLRKWKHLFKQMPRMRRSQTSVSWGLRKCLSLSFPSFIFHNRRLTVESWSETMAVVSGLGEDRGSRIFDIRGGGSLPSSPACTPASFYPPLSSLFSLGSSSCSYRTHLSWILLHFSLIWTRVPVWLVVEAKCNGCSHVVHGKVFWTGCLLFSYCLPHPPTPPPSGLVLSPFCHPDSCLPGPCWMCPGSALPVSRPLMTYLISSHLMAFLGKELFLACWAHWS